MPLDVGKAQVGLLSCLRVLNLRENRLTAVPPSISNCVSLIELHLGNDAGSRC